MLLGHPPWEGEPEQPSVGTVGERALNNKADEAARREGHVHSVVSSQGQGLGAEAVCMLPGPSGEWLVLELVH